MTLAYAIAIFVVLLLCGLGLSIGLILRGRALQACGRATEAANAHGHDIECPNCSGKAGACRRRETASE
jgi:hypothetical protein